MRIEASPTGFSLTAIDERGRLLICGQTFREGNEYANRFVEVPQLPPVTRAAAGADRCAAVTADGRLFTWGGGPVARCVAVNPKEVVFPRGEKVTDAAVGDLFSAALTASGRLYRWGETAGAGDGLTETGLGEAGRTRLRSLSCGYDFAAACGEDGCVYVWGRNVGGVFGSGYRFGCESAVPLPVDVSLFGSRSVRKVYGGHDCLHVLLSDGSLCSWGLETSGEFGCGAAVPRITDVPQKAELPD